MKNTMQCLKCDKKFEYIISRVNKVKYCSKKCQGLVSIEKFWINRFSWNTATYEQKINRLKEMYNKKVIKKDNCWSWNGVIAKTGYGVLEYLGKQCGAHRASWIIHNGEIPENNWVLHKCDNPICSNPGHLFLGKPRDNTQDMIKKKRGNYCKQTSKNAKISIENAKEIKILLKTKSQYEIAKIYNVSRGCIQDIHRGKSWKDT